MALYTDNYKYAAEIIEHLPDFKYSVLFYDGIIKKNLPERSLDIYTESAGLAAEKKAEELYGVPSMEQRVASFERYQRRRGSARYRIGNDFYKMLLGMIIIE